MTRWIRRIVIGPAVSPRRRVGENDHAVRADRPRVEEPQLRTRAALVEEALACTKNDGEDHEAVLIDEVFRSQGSGQVTAAGDEDVPSRPRLDPCHLGADVMADDTRVFPGCLGGGGRGRDDELGHAFHPRAERIGAHGRPRLRETLVRDTAEQLRVRRHQLIEFELVTLVSAVELEYPAQLSRRVDDAVHGDELGHDQLSHVVLQSMTVARGSSRSPVLAYLDDGRREKSSGAGWPARQAASRRERPPGRHTRVALGGRRRARRMHNGGPTMTLSLSSPAPDFEAETTQGKIAFHDWIGDSWAVLFSHPKDFTPVCTTELGYMARIQPEFERRNVKVIGLSVDPVDKHEKWADDIEETQGARPTYPIIADADFNVSKLYEMLPASTSGDPAQRTPADNQTVRNVFVVGPDKKVKLILVYPMTTGRNFDEVLRVIDSLQLTAKHRVSTPANWKQGDDVIIAGSVSDDEAKQLFPGYTSPKPYIRITPQPK